MTGSPRSRYIPMRGGRCGPSPQRFVSDTPLTRPHGLAIVSRGRLFLLSDLGVFLPLANSIPAAGHAAGYAMEVRPSQKAEIRRPVSAPNADLLHGAADRLRSTRKASSSIEFGVVPAPSRRSWRQPLKP